MTTDRPRSPDATEKKPAAALAPAPHCPVCAGEADRARAALCHACLTPHHAECWEYNRGCGRYGCGSRTRTWLPATVQAGAAPHVELSRPLPLWLQAMLAVAWVASLPLASVLGQAIPGPLGALLFLGWVLTSWLPLGVVLGLRLVTRVDAACRVLRQEVRLADHVLHEWDRTLSFESIRGLQVLPGGDTGSSTRAWGIWLTPEEGEPLLLDWSVDDLARVLGRAESLAAHADTIVSLSARGALAEARQHGLLPPHAA